MPSRWTDEQSPDPTRAEAKHLAQLKLEADVHAFFEAMAAAGVSDEEALEVARTAIRSALGAVYAGQSTAEWRRRSAQTI